MNEDRTSLPDLDQPEGNISLDWLVYGLHNEEIQATILGVAGNICSLRNRRTGTEWALSPLRPMPDRDHSGGFELSGGGGFDECLPTVAATASAPDHGELWRQEWSVDQTTEPDALIMRAIACGGAIEFARRAHLDGAGLVLDYTVKNIGSTSQSLLYSAHPLLQVQQGDRLELPAEVTTVRIEGSLQDRLGRHGDRIAWPRDTSQPHVSGDISVVGPPDGKQADKLFAGPLTEGRCRLVRPSTGEGIEITFDAAVLPWLGLWICRAAWPEDGAKKQYTVAFEPTSAPSDSLAEAERQGTAWRLEPGAGRTWSIRFRLIAPQDVPGHQGRESR